jgi:hypothetical protein
MKYIKTFESFYIGCWMILDGHHRLLKDINNGIVNIKDRILDLKSFLSKNDFW